MKPVNLLPSGGAGTVAAATASKSNTGVVGGAIAGGIAVLAVAGYFAMARVDSVKSETQRLTTTAASATSEITSVRSQVASLGQPVIDSDIELAAGAEKVLVSAYTERRDYAKMMRELVTVMDGTKGWYTLVDVSTIGGGGAAVTGTGEAKTVTIEGYMPSKERLAAFNERLESTATLKDAEVVQIGTKLKSIGSSKRVSYWKFKITANLIDTVLPRVADVGAQPPGTDTSGTTVSSTDEPKLTLGLGASGGAANSSSASSVAKPKLAVTAAPKNPFDVAASTAAKGSLK